MYLQCSSVPVDLPIRLQGQVWSKYDAPMLVVAAFDRAAATEMTSLDGIVVTAELCPGTYLDSEVHFIMLF